MGNLEHKRVISLLRFWTKNITPISDEYADFGSFHRYQRGSSQNMKFGMSLRELGDNQYL